MAGSEPVVAVQVVVEQLLAGHAHGVGVVVEQYECHRKPVLQRGVNLHAGMMIAPSPAITTVRPLPAQPTVHRAAEGHPDTGTEAVAHAAHAECDREPTVPANG